MASAAIYVLMTSQVLMMTSLQTVQALECPPPEENAMSPEDPFVLYGEDLRLCCNVTRAEREVTAPDDVMFYRLDTPVTGGTVSWEKEETAAARQRAVVCWQRRLEEEEEEKEEEEDGGRRGHNRRRFSGKGTFYYCRLRQGPPAAPGPAALQQNETALQQNETALQQNETALQQNETALGLGLGQCLGYQSVQTDRSLFREVQKVRLWCVTEGSKFRCEWADIRARFLHPDRVPLPRLLYGSPRAVNECPVQCDDDDEGLKKCRCLLQQGRDFQLHDRFLLQISLQWRYVRHDPLYGPPPAAALNLSDPQPYINATFSPWRRVKVSPPRALNVTSPEPRCVEVTWQPGDADRGDAKVFIYLLTVQAERPHYSPPKNEEFVDDGSPSRVVCGLSPFTVYVISLKRRADHSDVWSDVTNASVLTLMAPPDESPKLAPGYLIGPNQQRTLFWQAIPDSSFNSPDVQYLVNMSRGPELGQEGKQQQDRLLPPRAALTNGTQLTFAADRSNSDHRPRPLLLLVHVLAQNDAGPADNASLLVLDLRRDGAQNVRGVVESETEDEMTLTVTWLPEPSRDYSYTVHWCIRSGYNTSVCNTGLQWSTVGPGKTWFTTRVPGGRPGRVLYGVSLTRATAQPVLASGFRFNACMYHRNADGTLQMIYTPGCEEIPQTMAVSGQLNSMVIGIAVPFTLILLLLCGTAIRKRYLRRKRKFSPNLAQSTLLYEEDRNLLYAHSHAAPSPNAASNHQTRRLPSTHSPPPSSDATQTRKPEVPEVRDCAGQEEAKRERAGGNASPVAREEKEEEGPVSLRDPLPYITQPYRKTMSNPHPHYPPTILPNPRTDPPQVPSSTACGSSNPQRRAYPSVHQPPPEPSDVERTPSRDQKPLLTSNDYVRCGLEGGGSSGSGGGDGGGGGGGGQSDADSTDSFGRTFLEYGKTLGSQTGSDMGEEKYSLADLMDMDLPDADSVADCGSVDSCPTYSVAMPGQQGGAATLAAAQGPAAGGQSDPRGRAPQSTINATYVGWQQPKL